VISEPPLLDGAVQVRVTWSPLGTPARPVGAEGTVAGTPEALASEEIALEPARFVATTAKTYVTPLVRPVTVQVVPEVTQLAEPGEAETV
jgi:hypothetical protein